MPSQISWVLEGLSSGRFEDIQESRSAAKDSIDEEIYQGIEEDRGHIGLDIIRIKVARSRVFSKWMKTVGCE